MMGTSSYFGQPNVIPGFGHQLLQLNGVLAQQGLPPLTAACLAAQSAFLNVLGQYASQAIGGWPGQPQPPGWLLGQFPLSAVGNWPSQQQSASLFAGPLGQGLPPFVPSYSPPLPLAALIGQLPPVFGGWPGQQHIGGAFGGGAFGQRGPASAIGGYSPFQVTPQMSYAG